MIIRYRHNEDRGTTIIEVQGLKWNDEHVDITTRLAFSYQIGSIRSGILRNIRSLDLCLTMEGDDHEGTL